VKPKTPEDPLISVVMPTFARPHLMLGALRSALEQTWRAVEVVIVVDGRDRETLDALARVSDARVRVVLPERHLGNADARNAGVAKSRGRWIALLDDDDAWAPEKLAEQLATAERSSYRDPIVTCHILARDEEGDFVWPRRRPAPDEPLGDYLFCRRSPFTGEGIVQTSTIFTSRGLLGAVPFASGLGRYVDIDWLLRASARDGVGLEFVRETRPLSLWSMERRRARLSTGADGPAAVDWGRARRHLLSPRAYAAFMMTLASRNAALAGQWRMFLPLAVEAFRHGQPTPTDVVTHVANFVVPERLRHLLARAFARTVGRPGPGREGSLESPWAPAHRA
jgi:hypothetical protein